MVKNHITVISAIVILSCGRPNSTDLSANKMDTVKIETSVDSANILEREPETNSTDETFKKINYQLYNQLIDGNFGPFEVKNDSGYYALDIDSYFNHLEKIGIFSSEFYKNERRRVSQCQKDLEELRFTGTTDMGWEPESCFFFNYMYWLKSQESPSGYEMDEFEINGNSASAKMTFFNSYDGKKSHWSGSLNIEYKKGEQDWEVTKITSN
jgi:hypothetical protein